MKKYFLYVITALFLVACGGELDKKEGKHKHEEGTEHSHAKGDESHKHKDGTTHNHSKGKAAADCLHCGMPSAEFPKWKVKVTAKAGDIWYCSPRCMFISTLDKAKAPKEIQAIKVVEYYNTKPIDGKTAYYVTGSDILGPMGHDLVPLKDKAAADDFKKEHKGAKVLKFDEVTMETVKAMVGK
ncbi:nitrous oxide reductase accessory protein NosL [Microscilla marina]|uniref:Involved in nitrous oxide reduction n=1 Tax=Microscilla marina ATCC 23134 TaxID=313606 RepID=A1ZTA2_MICM2|nr:nitrous oxide reductase accessory protein NosL [Microscilla marina]EAY26324.1 involved in nitrous oxide reduction [Microscilla marina ATCC 23134]